MPYNNTPPDTLVGSGAAEFGISFQDSFTYAKAGGADAVSVMAILQHWATQIAVRADRADITSPRDLDGKTYGGFGAAYEVPKMQAVIKDAGGTGQFRNVVLGTAAYEALYAGQVDFTEPFVAWEGIEAELRGQPLKTFNYTDYGFPDAYSVLLIGNGDLAAGATRRRRRRSCRPRSGATSWRPTTRRRASSCWRRPTPARSPSPSWSRAASRCSASATCATSPARSGRRRWRSGRASPGSWSTPAR